MGTAPRAAIAPPMAMPPRVGLLPTIAAIQPDTGAGSAESGADRWGAGFAYNPENCGLVGTADPCNPGAWEVPDNLDEVQGDPFEVWAGDKCSPFQPREYQARARRQLRAAASYQIARELWRGDLGATAGWANRPLADPASDVLTDGPTSIVDALACLEQAMGNCLHGGRGMIHVTRQQAIFMVSHQLVRREGQLLLTPLDTFVVADAGYDGTGPNGEAPAEGSVWCYGTSIV